MGVVQYLTTQLAGGTGRHRHMDGWDGGWMWLWGTLMMLTWVAIVAVAAWLVLRARDGGRTTPGTARQILDERYARGDISTEEYRERLDQLREAGRS
jgi:putative membrane protein